MRTEQSFVAWFWKIPVCAVAVVAGQMLGAALVSASGLRFPEMPGTADETTQFLLMLAAALTMALAVAALAVGLTGRWWERWAVLAAFLYIVHGVGNAIEASVFSTLGGEPATLVLQLPGTWLGALAAALLFPAPAGETLARRLGEFFRGRPAGRLALRLALAVLAFPFFYLLFGMMIAPIVTPHYARLDFLVIPPMPTILAVLFTRSALFLLVSLPVVAGWRLSRGRLIAALGFAHFVAVGLAGLIQAPFFPAVLRWTHGVEILADSVCYAWALVWLLFPRRDVAAGESQPPRERLPRDVPASTSREGSLLVAKIVLLTIALLVVQGVGSTFLPSTQETGGPADAAQQTAGFLGVALFVGLLQTIALAYPVVRSRWHGWLLALAVCFVYFGSATFLGLIETVVYPAARMPPGMLAGLLLMGLFTAAVFSPILVLTLGQWRAEAAAGEAPSSRLQMSWQSWAWKLAVGAAVMTALYYLFGYYVAWKDPALRAYYGGTDPGSFIAQMRGVVEATPWMVPFQYLRALLWVLLALPVIGMMRGRWWEAGLAVSLLFTVPALYLLLPNPLMPEAVRLTHLVETMPYQFLFGWFVVWLFTRGSARERLAPAAVSTT